MKNFDEEKLRKVLADCGIEDIDYYVNEADAYRTPTPMLSKVVFMRECFSAILRKDNKNWLDDHIEAHERYMGKTGLHSKMLDPDVPELLAALVRVKEQGVDPKDLLIIIREYQYDVLGSISSLIDGGIVFEEGIESDWGLFQIDEKLKPTYDFGNIQDMIWDFDPDRDK
ncbi:MAG: hypothetical protein SD837_00060 [Candidatus Electrothrix scaldis]|nr:MAG: hypothetical protein SD837_00060 [Candidatus Electrothrix sp. GW3-3]